MKKDNKYEDLTEMNGVPLCEIGKDVTHSFKDLDEARAKAALISGQFIEPKKGTRVGIKK